MTRLPDVKCAAMEWQRTATGMDYVECSRDGATRLCRLEGLLLAVEVYLCGKHEAYFRGNPKGWGSTKVTLAKEVTHESNHVRPL